MTYRMTDLRMNSLYSRTPGGLGFSRHCTTVRATSENSPRASDAFARKLKSEGLTDFKISSQYRVGDSEFFEFTGHRGTASVKGAGSIQSCLILDASDPQAHLPVVYTYLAKVMRDEL